MFLCFKLPFGRKFQTFKNIQLAGSFESIPADLMPFDAKSRISIISHHFSLFEFFSDYFLLSANVYEDPAYPSDDRDQDYLSTVSRFTVSSCNLTDNAAKSIEPSLNSAEDTVCAEEEEEEDEPVVIRQCVRVESVDSDEEEEAVVEKPVAVRQCVRVDTVESEEEEQQPPSEEVAREEEPSRTTPVDEIETSSVGESDTDTFYSVNSSLDLTHIAPGESFSG